MQSYKYLMNKWRNINITQESCSQKKEGSRIVKDVDLEENCHKAQGLDSSDFCFTLASAQLVSELTVHAMVSSNLSPIEFYPGMLRFPNTK